MNKEPLHCPRCGSLLYKIEPPRMTSSYTLFPADIPAAYMCANCGANLDNFNELKKEIESK